MTDKVIDHKYTRHIICPHCGNEVDSTDYAIDGLLKGEETCEECGKKYKYEVNFETTWITTKISEINVDWGEITEDEEGNLYFKYDFQEHENPKEAWDEYCDCSEMLKKHGLKFTQDCLTEHDCISGTVIRIEQPPKLDINTDFGKLVIKEFFNCEHDNMTVKNFREHMNQKIWKGKINE